MNLSRRHAAVAAVAFAVASMIAPLAAHAETGGELAAKARRALTHLYATEPKSRLFAKNAKAVLVFPTILKGGLVFGAQTGNGVLFEHGKVAGYYNISAASFGLQAGGQTFSEAMFFMSPGALEYIHKSDGWSLGTGPSIVVVDKGESRDANTETLSHDIYAFSYREKGLMAGIDVKGSKITRYHPE